MPCNTRACSPYLAITLYPLTSVLPAFTDSPFQTVVRIRVVIPTLEMKKLRHGGINLPTVIYLVYCELGFEPRPTGPRAMSFTAVADGLKF